MGLPGPPLPVSSARSLTWILVSMPSYQHGNREKNVQPPWTSSGKDKRLPCLPPNAPTLALADVKGVMGTGGGTRAEAQVYPQCEGLPVRRS